MVVLMSRNDKLATHEPTPRRGSQRQLGSRSAPVLIGALSERRSGFKSLPLNVMRLGLTLSAA
jgi:hypothetical protein